MESDYKCINSRLRDITNDDEINYILVPSDISIVKETAVDINKLLEKFYSRQINYNRSEKAILQIFTNISHDLRTPITVLKGYIEMLYLQSQKEELSSSMRATVEKMQTNSNELVNSINNLFNMAKIQSGDMILNLQKSNLTQLCHEIILEFYDLLDNPRPRFWRFWARPGAAWPSRACGRILCRATGPYWISWRAAARASSMFTQLHVENKWSIFEWINH